MKAKADASVTTVNAKAEAEATTVKGSATAKITQSIGDAEASVLEKKTKALGEIAYAQIQIAESLAKHNIKLVPDILITGEKGGSNGMLDALLATEYFKNVKKAPEGNSIDVKKIENE